METEEEKTDKSVDEAKMEHAKPKLTADEQIAHLKSKGVRFELCSEGEAKRWLEDYAYYFKLASYRCLFPKRIGGDHDGEYANLDFTYLVDLYSVDRKLRYTLLPLTLDIEHFARAKVSRMVSEREDEDGYSLVADYLAGLTPDSLKRRVGDVAKLETDPYCKQLIEKYREDMPEWVAMELWSFGSFIDFYRFCAKRWNDSEMKAEHYLLRRVKSARNAFAHSTCTLNTLARSEKGMRTAVEVMEALAQAGLSKHARQAKMKNALLHQVATVVYSYSRFVDNPEYRKDAVASLKELSSRMNEHIGYYANNDVIRSSFAFIEKALTVLR